jgi:hypothetical protein
VVSKTKVQTPPLDEFIDLAERRRESHAHGYQAMRGRATVAVYNHKRRGKPYQTLTIRIADDLARRHKLVIGSRLCCLVHPDQQFIALRPADGSARGAALFRAPHGTALVYQTTLKGGTLEPGPAQEASLVQDGETLVVALTQD